MKRTFILMAALLVVLTTAACLPNPPHTNCVADPSDCSYRDDSDTGSRIATNELDDPSALWNSTHYRITEPGVYEGYHFTDGSVVVDADNVTIRDSLIELDDLNDFFGITTINNHSGLRVEYVEIDGNSVGRFGIGAEDNTYISRSDIHHVEDGVTTGSSNVTVNLSYIHDLNYEEENHFPHYDGFQTDGNQAVLRILNSTIIIPQGENSGGNSAVYLTDGSGGGLSDVLVGNNLLAGGVYTVRVDGGFEETHDVTAVKVLGNLINPGDFGGYAVTDADSVGIQIFDNRNDATGAVLPEHNPPPE